jgi:hypothetical protein
LTTSAVVTRLVFRVRNSAKRLRQSEAYLAEAQGLSHTGSRAWTPATGEIRYWSEECYRVLGLTRTVGSHDSKPSFNATRRRRSRYRRFNEIAG